MLVKFKFNLGDEVKDKVSGFKGVIVAQTMWLNGCARILVQSQDLDKEIGIKGHLKGAGVNSAQVNV